MNTEQYSQGAPRGGAEEAPNDDDVDDIMDKSTGNMSKDDGVVVSWRRCRKSL